MEIEIKNIEGKAVKKVTVSDDIFAVPMNEHVLHTVCKAYRANRRQGTHATKTRSKVAHSGKKPFKQKGTGNARQGSTAGPHMYGGAVAHGPQPRSYRQDLNKKVKQLAMRIALSDKARNGKLVVVDDFALSGYSTKKITGMMGSLNVEKALFSDERKDDYLVKSVRNLYGSNCVSTNEINAEHVLRHQNLVISEAALNALQQKL